MASHDPIATRSGSVIDHGIKHAADRAHGAEEKQTMARPTAKAKPQKTLEQTLWEAADKLRGNQEPSEYKHVVLGLVFLKYISDRFEERRKVLKDDLIADGIKPERLDSFLEDRDEYTSHNVFWVPEDARWEHIQARAKLSTVGEDVDSAMDLIEKENPSIRGVLPRNYARDGLDKRRLGELVDLIGSIGFTTSDDHGADDVLGRVYEYFLGQFAGKETGKDAGAFYTPRSVVKTLVEMLEPYQGRVYDPAAGSGGMFVQSAEFVKAHGGKRTDISVYGQEFTDTTWKLAKMNLALRGIEADMGSHSADSFTEDLHPDLRADFVIANPPFNVSDWWDAKLADDPRWKFGTPPQGNANFAWVQHFLHHLRPSGRAGFVLANMSVASDDNAERAIRRALVENNLVDCIVTMPDKLFINTPAAVSLWFLDKGRDSRGEKKTLLVDASRIGAPLTRTRNFVTDAAIEDLASLYHAWRVGIDELPDIASLPYARVTRDDVEANDWILQPSAYTSHSGSGSGRAESISQAIDASALASVLESIGRIEERASALRSAVDRVRATGDQRVAERSIVKIGDLVEQVKETLGNREEPELLTCTESSGLVLQRERFASRVATENASKYKMVKKGDIVYNPYLLWKGSIDQCWIVDEGITSPAYEVFRVKDGFDPVVVGELLTSPNMVRRYDGISFGTIQRRRRAAPTSFLDMTVEYPSGGASEDLRGLLQELRDFQAEGRLIERGAKSAVTDIFDGLITPGSEFPMEAT